MYRFNKKPEKNYMDLVTAGLVSNDPQSTLVGAIFTEGARRSCAYPSAPCSQPALFAI